MFHIVMAQESKSGILYVLGTLLNNLYFSHWMDVRVDYKEPIRIHQLLLDALRARDSHLAEQCMIEQIGNAKRFYFQGPQVSAGDSITI